VSRRYDAFLENPRYDFAAPAIAPLQVRRFTTTYLKSVLAGQLGRFGSLLRRARSRPAFQIDESGNGHEQRAPNALCTQL
jgi:hypothetical protein